MPSTTYHASDFFAAAAGLDVEVVVGTDRRQAVSTPELGKVLALPFSRPEEATRQVLAFSRQRPLTAVIPTDDDTALLAAILSEALELPANPPSAALAARYKPVLRERTAAAGLPTPRFRVFGSGEDPAPHAGSVGFPCILKPTFLAASRGVIRADDPAGVTAAALRIRKILAQEDVVERGGEEAGRILIEEFVPGPELALEGLLRRGGLMVLALFDKPDPLDGPYFEETLYITPSRLPRDRRESVVRAAENALKAVGLIEGPVHVELRLGPDGPVVIDLAARMIGGLCSRTLRFGSGISLEELILKHAVEPRYVPPPRERIASGVLMMPIPRGGTLREVRGLEEARALPGVVGVEVTIPAGQPVVPLPEGDRYLGFAFARAGSAEEVEATLRQVRERIEIVIEP